MSRNTRDKELLKILTADIIRQVERYLHRYYELSYLAEMECRPVDTHDINIRSASAYDPIGGGRSGRISRPTEDIVLKNADNNIEIQKAREIVDAINKGIESAARKAGVSKQREVREAVRAVLLDGCGCAYASVHTLTDISVPTVTHYCNLALFFVAYNLGFLATYEYERGNKLLRKNSWEKERKSMALKNASEEMKRKKERASERIARRSAEKDAEEAAKCPKCIPETTEEETPKDTT